MAKKKTEMTPEQAAKEWIQLKEQGMLIEKRLANVKHVLLAHLQEQPDKSCEFIGYKFSLIETSREHFKLKDAKAKIDNRILKPYISITEFTQIRTSFQGNDDELAA